MKTPRQLVVALACAALAAGCRSHSGDRAEVMGADCVTCHLDEYRATTSPVHEGLFPTTCADCHSVSAWVPALGGGAGDVNDPARDIVVDAQIPRYSGTSIVSVTAESESLTQPMIHLSPNIDPAAMESCSNCHSSLGSIYPGIFHGSLISHDIPQPTQCSDCHSPATMPVGFVGPLATDPARVPSTGEMKHDAVVWSNDAPTAEPLVTEDCGTCHVPPSNDALNATWATGFDAATPARYHASLDRAGIAQPGTCVDCHANSRPDHIIESGESSLPEGLSFDHSLGDGMSDCVSCHTDTTTWEGGLYHQPDDPLPPSCTTCHEGERPTSDSGWMSSTYADAPFDYGLNTYGVTHGAGADCVGCHTGPGTGGTETWVGGHFEHHQAGGLDAGTCVSCHASQRPDVVLGVSEAAALLPNGFDHARNGTGDCFGCHQASVDAGTYASYFNAGGTLPGGDWKDGTEYPGSFVSSTSVHITVNEIALHRSGPNNLVTSTSTSAVAYYNGMLHTSMAVPSQISPGTSPTMPDSDSCWHCHTSTGTTVDSYVDGELHTSIMMFRATPTSPVTPLTQPTRCNDCHQQMRPHDIVEKMGSVLQPMDHFATFTGNVNIGGQMASGVADLDCSTCHGMPGETWSDGVFHANIGSATPSDCTSCHYPAMADASHADRTSGTEYAMRHRSPQITFQSCGTCHTMALGRATMAPSWPLWNDGNYHGHAMGQPSACVDCHTVSEPTTTTRGGVVYTLASGGTATNGGQYMSHTTSHVTSRDCAACHMADATTMPSGWSTTTPFHSVVTSGVTTCRNCHGLTNGLGMTVGTNNNMPAGVNDTASITVAPAATGIAGRHDQIDHSDINVTGHDCNFCHTEVGPAASGAARGHEWAQGSFHDRFSGSSTLLINGTTGRCDHCHANLRPTMTIDAFSHSGIGTSDCSQCHSFPGTGSITNPNWAGAMGGAPASISAGGFTIPAPPAPSPRTQGGITGLPHPSTGACSSCHTGGSGGRMAIGYDHASTAMTNHCNACHEAGSDLVSPVWNGATSTSAGAGDTRPFTLPSVRATFSGNSRTETYPNHFYPVDCDECHNAPSGIAVGTTGSAYTTAWRFNHNCRTMTPVTTCQMCHTRTRCE
ncbi:MAG: hypothetical protein AB7S26_00950 [Sandaracinaceae bacterium]